MKRRVPITALAGPGWLRSGCYIRPSRQQKLHELNVAALDSHLQRAEWRSDLHTPLSRWPPPQPSAAVDIRSAVDQELCRSKLLVEDRLLQRGRLDLYALVVGLAQAHCVHVAAAAVQQPPDLRHVAGSHSIEQLTVLLAAGALPLASSCIDGSRCCWRLHCWLGRAGACAAADAAAAAAAAAVAPACNQRISSIHLCQRLSHLLRVYRCICG